MLITIHNLPSSTRYIDVKALLQSQCGLADGFVLDNLVSEGSGKKVTVGLAEEEDGAVMARKINGYYYNGHSLYVQDVRKSKKTSEQPYHASSSNMNMSNNSVPAEQPMNKLMMSTPFYNIPTQNPYYSMPQTSYMGYDSQQQQSVFQMSQVQYPQQVYSQAPLGFRPEGSYTNTQWSQNKQNDEKTNYGSQDYSERKPEKRSLDDRSGDNYSEINKRSRWDDSNDRGRSAYEERARSDDRGWQTRGKDENPSRSNNSNDSERRNDNRTGYGHSNDSKNYSTRPAEKVYYSDRSNDSRSGYDRSNENRRDFGISKITTENFDRWNSSNFGQSSEKNQKFDREYDNARNRSQTERSNSYEQSNKSFNKYHWPPLNAGPSRDAPGRSSDFHGGQNINTSHDQGPDSKTRVQVWENSSHPYNNKSSNFGPQKSSKYDTKKTPKGKTKVTYQLPTPADNAKAVKWLPPGVLTWRGQAASFIAKEVLSKAGAVGEVHNSVVLMKRLKDAIRKKIEKIVKHHHMPYEEILEKYRLKFSPETDHLFFNTILEKVKQEKTGLGTIKNRQLQFIPGIKDVTWVEGDYDSDYQPELQPVVFGKKKPSKKASKKAKAKSKVKSKRKGPPQPQNPPLIPSYYKGDKALFKQNKKQLSQDLSGNTEFPLDPLFEKAIDEELEPICQILKTENVTCGKQSDQIFKMIQESEASQEFKKGLKIQISKRLLNCGPFGIRIFGAPKLPRRTRLAEFLHPYKVLSLKSSKSYPMYMAECEDFVNAEKLFSKTDAVVDGMTLTFKPLQLVAPAPKMKALDIKKYFQDYIKSQIDKSKINILEYNDGKPYILTNKSVRKLKASQESNLNANDNETANSNDNGIVNINDDGTATSNEDGTATSNEDGTAENSAKKGENVKEKGEIVNVKEENPSTADIARTESVKCENIKEIEETSVKVELKPLVDIKSEETSKNNVNQENENNVVDKAKMINESKDKVIDEKNDNNSVCENVMCKDDVGDVIDGAGDDNEEDDDEPDDDGDDVDLNEINEDDLEDY